MCPYLLHYEGEAFNVGEIVAKSSKSCSDKPEGALWQPSLIHSLLTKANVKEYDDDEMVTKKCALDRIAVDRILRNQIKKGGDELNYRTSVGSATASATASTTVA